MTLPPPPVFRVLLIDDDPAYTEPLEQLFSQPPFEAKVCWNAEVGLSEAQGGGYHIIILDVMMPGLHGLTALKDLKSNPRTSGMPVFLSSSITDPKLQEQALAAGAAGFIPKGLELPKIMSRVRRALRI
ncbi:MAG: hypothetical protein A3J74_08875 [Elusimicrobia bacterium RIFCSPHIGHO2_02_FULL_57_9]|nr:MAG: hypothetical protein A3J74_08875 [Elusimicrobia bacterium RIFCSPHIGHO2_02_FULL_57_9]